MKLLNKDILIEFGFIENNEKIKLDCVVMTKDKMDIVVNNNGSIYYSNMGFDYPLRDTASLRKIFKEVRSEELKPLEKTFANDL